MLDKVVDGENSLFFGWLVGMSIYTGTIPVIHSLGMGWVSLQEGFLYMLMEMGRKIIITLCVSSLLSWMLFVDN